MPLWGNTDTTGNSAIFAPAQVKLAPNTANRDDLFGNTTAGAFFTGATIGQYGVDEAEMRATRADHEARPAHAGWVLRTTGSGGRANRVQHEVLVAMGSISGDSENTAFQQLAVVIDANPVDATGDASNDDIVTFTAHAYATPTGSVTYKWQKWGGASFANVADAGAYSNTATAELSVLANTAANAEIYRCGVYATGATTRYTSNAVITIVA